MGLKTSEKREKLRAMTDDELRNEITREKKESYDLVCRNAARQLQNTAAIRQSKKQIARALTILRERELAEQAANAKQNSSTARSDTKGRWLKYRKAHRESSMYPEAFSHRPKLANLSFIVDLGPNAVDGVGFPVEVRRPDLHLIGRVLSTENLEVEPSTYIVTAYLPNGEELSKSVTVTSKDQEVALLSEWALNNKSQDVMFHVFASAPVHSLADRPNVQGVVRAFSYNKRHEFVLHSQEKWASVEPADKDTEYLTVHHTQVALLQVMSPGCPVWNTLLPVGPQVDYPLLLVRCRSKCTPWIDVYLRNLHANAMLQYAESGLLGQAGVSTRSSELDMSQLLSDEKTDPISAAATMYTLLRFATANRFEDLWSERLHKQFTWFSDGTVLHSENLARAGRHDEAFSYLLNLEERGLPCFSAGLSYAVDRLKYYLWLGSKEFGEDNIKRGQTLLRHLTTYADHSNLRSTFLTFSGVNPNLPNGQIVSNVSSYEGLILSCEADK